MSRIFGMKQLLGLVCLIALVSCKTKKSGSEKVKVAVYYEALCPDSINFIVKQLYPAWKSLNDGFKLKLIPYGKAIQNKVNNKWEFECQHGPRECYGNKIQGCVLKYKDLADEKKVDMINCLMSARKPDAALQDCSDKLEFKNADTIKKCADGHKGDDILAAYGDKTAALRPQLSFVPTIVFNENYDAGLQSRALNDFKSVICELAVKKPAKCP